MRLKYFIMLFILSVGAVLGFTMAGIQQGGESAAEMILRFCTGATQTSMWGAFWKSLMINYRMLVLILLAGLLIPLRVLAPFAVGVKSFSMGYTLGFTTLTFGAKGFLLAFVSILPQLLTTIPLLIFLAMSAIGWNNSKIAWLLRCSVFAGLLAICSAIDGFIVPVFLSGAGKLF